MKERTYESGVHFYGILWDIAALLLFLMLPVAICLHLGVWHEARYVFEGLLPVALLFYPTSVIEVFTYTPLLGAGGTYLSFVTGNITNLKLPCGLNAMENAGVRANSEEGEVISTIAIATSSIVTTLIIAVGVVAFSPVLPYLTDDRLRIRAGVRSGRARVVRGAWHQLLHEALEARLCTDRRDRDPAAVQRHAVDRGAHPRRRRDLHALGAFDVQKRLGRAIK